MVGQAEVYADMPRLIAARTNPRNRKNTWPESEDWEGYSRRAFVDSFRQCTHQWHIMGGSTFLFYQHYYARRNRTGREVTLPRRNQFIANQFYDRTGRRRTHAQVASHLQQLRQWYKYSRGKGKAWDAEESDSE